MLLLTKEDGIMGNRSSSSMLRIVAAALGFSLMSVAPASADVDGARVQSISAMPSGDFYIYLDKSACSGVTTPTKVVMYSNEDTSEKLFSLLLAAKLADRPVNVQASPHSNKKYCEFSLAKML